MSEQTGTWRGVVHGRTIQLDREPDLPNGQVVAVTLQPVSLPAEEGIRRSAGAWREDAQGLDAFLEQMRESRRSPRREPA